MSQSSSRILSFSSTVCSSCAFFIIAVIPLRFMARLLLSPSLLSSFAIILSTGIVVAMTTLVASTIVRNKNSTNAMLLKTGRLVTADEAKKIVDLPLTALNVVFGGKIEESQSSTTLKAVVETFTGDGMNPVLTFVIRRPGCRFCREHAQQLRDWKVGTATSVGMFGIVKETGVDDEGLYAFHQNYFTYPLYKDMGLEIYQALGNRGIFQTIFSKSWNPFVLYGLTKLSYTRTVDKGIDGNLKGEGLIQGAVFIFDKNAELRYIFEEQIGDELDVNEINQAVEELRLEDGTEHESPVETAATASNENVEL